MLKNSVCRYIPPHLFGIRPILRIRNLGQVVENYRCFKSQAAATGTVCGVVLKADAHGIGAEDVAPMLYDEGARLFFVEDCIEGVVLRKVLPQLDAQIYILGGLLDNEEAELQKHRLTPCLNSLSQIERWRASTSGTGNAAIHFDSGMNRIGLGPDEIHYFAKNFQQLLGGVKVDFVMSHLATVKSSDHSMSNEQLTSLRSFLKLFERQRVSFSCTDGVILLPSSDFSFDIVRIGIGLLGGGPNANATLVGTSPAIEYYVKYSQVRWLESGQKIGYGGAYTAKHKTRIALAHIGYKDGYLRTLSNTDSSPSGAWMAIGGIPTPVLGKISLGLTTIDVTQVPDTVLANYKYAEVIGPNVDMRKVADISGCYEVIASLGRRNIKISDYTLKDFESALLKTSP